MPRSHEAVHLGDAVSAQCQHLDYRSDLLPLLAVPEVAADAPHRHAYVFIAAAIAAMTFARRDVTV